MSDDISSSEIKEKTHPGVSIPFLAGIEKKDFFENPEASKEFSKTSFQSTIVRFVLVVAALSLAWLMLIYMIATLNVPQAGKIFILDKEEKIIIISAIVTNSLGFAFAVIKSLFSSAINHEKEVSISASRNTAQNTDKSLKS
jgi:hypothetical protein